MLLQKLKILNPLLKLEKFRVTNFYIINSYLLRFSTAKGFSTGLSLVGPTEVSAYKSFLFNEGFLKVENKEHLFDLLSHFFIALCSNALRSSKVSQSTFTLLAIFA